MSKSRTILSLALVILFVLAALVAPVIGSTVSDQMTNHETSDGLAGVAETQSADVLACIPGDPPGSSGGGCGGG